MPESIPNRPPRPARATDLATGQTGGPPDPAHAELVERITASLAEMFARALRQSVEQAVEQAMGGRRDASGPGQAAQRAAHYAQAQKPT